MRDKIFDEIKIFALNTYVDKIDYGDVVEYLGKYDENTMLAPGIIIDGVAINLFSHHIYPVLHNFSDNIMLGTPYITHIYNYGEKIENDNGYYLLDLEVEEAKEYYEQAKILENKLYR